MKMVGVLGLCVGNVTSARVGLQNGAGRLLLDVHRGRIYEDKVAESAENINQHFIFFFLVIAQAVLKHKQKS